MYIYIQLVQIFSGSVSLFIQIHILYIYIIIIILLNYNTIYNINNLLNTYSNAI